MFNLWKSKKNVLGDLGPLYHDYRFFGVRNEQLPGIFQANQQAKFPILLAYISLAIAKCRHNASAPVTFTELFCADGFYTMLATKLGADQCVGIDSNKDGFLDSAAGIAQRLEIDNARFIRQEISGNSVFAPADIVANLGGLYHVADPRPVLEMSYRTARRFLIVQNVVSLASDDEEYFAAPAPGWSWGNRYSRQSFAKLIRDLGYRVIDSHFNILAGNDRPEDQGSVYYLIAKEGSGQP